MTDPDFLNPHAPGVKLDKGKNELSLVILSFARALQVVGEVGTYGARKYSRDGWRHVEDGQYRYTNAMLRHLLQEPQESHDPETGLLHAAHTAWNALARLELMLDDTPNEALRRAARNYEQVVEKGETDGR